MNNPPSTTTKWQQYVIKLDRDCALIEWSVSGIRRSYESPEFLEQFIDVSIRKLQDAKRDLQYFKNVERPANLPPQPPILPR